MTNPITDLLALRRLPAALAADLGVITMQVLEQRTAVIETTVLRLASDADQARRACPIPMMTRGC